MQWNLEGMQVTGKYMGQFNVSGVVTLSRVQYGGEIAHHIQLDFPITVYGAQRDRVILEHKYIESVAEAYDWELDRGQNFAAGY